MTVDNITATDISVTGTGGPLGPLNFSTIKEVKIITNNFSAEYGRNANSQLQLITKSGTNVFHGEAYEYLKNNELNARDFFDRVGRPRHHPPKSVWRRFQRAHRAQQDPISCFL